VPDIAALRVSPQEEAEWIVWREGAAFYAKSGRTGEVATSADGESLLNYVLSKARDGDTVVVKDVVYADALVSSRRVRLTGSGAIYTKTGKIVRVLGPVLADLEVDFGTPRVVSQAITDQFDDPNLSGWTPAHAGDGSASWYEETKTVGGATFTERGVALNGGTQANARAILYRTVPWLPLRTRMIVQVVDLANAPTGTSKPIAYFGIGDSGVTGLRINDAGSLVVVYTRQDYTVQFVDTGVNIAGKPAVLAVDYDPPRGWLRVAAGGSAFTFTDALPRTDINSVALAAEQGHTVKVNLVRVEPLPQPTPVSSQPAEVAASYGRADTAYHPLGVSESLGAYAVGLVRPDRKTYIEVRRLADDGLAATVALDETLDFTDEHVYVYTRFASESGKAYMYVLVSPHGAACTIYKIDAETWSRVWKATGPTETYGKLVWGWRTGLMALLRDGSGNLSAVHIDPATGSQTPQAIVAPDSGTSIYGYFSPDWSDDGYLWIAWTNYVSSTGRRENVYALALDRGGNAYAPDGSRLALPVSSTESRCLVEATAAAQPFVRPAREGAVVFRAGFYTPASPKAWWLRLGKTLELELPSLPRTGLSYSTVGRLPAAFELSYVLRQTGTTLHQGRAVATVFGGELDPRAHLRPSDCASAKYTPTPDGGRLLVFDGTYTRIYRVPYRAKWDGEIKI